jgi:hypothetical protein
MKTKDWSSKNKRHKIGKIKEKKKDKENSNGD